LEEYFNTLITSLDPKISILIPEIRW